MRCHYEVLGVERDADDTTIKKAYRKIALKLHPDKNPDRIEECTQLFHEVQAAYDVLSDKQERAFYDKHREAILKGGDDFVDDSVDLMHYFNTSVYKGFGDGVEGFYTVYRNLFRQIAEEDEPYLKDEDLEDYFVPEFGESTSDFEETVQPFYSYWMGYCTKKSYVWKEKYDIRQAPNRPTQRLMEKENKKLRDACRRKRNEEIRALVSFVRKRDKRVIAYRKFLEQKQEEQKRKLNDRQEEARKNRNKMLEDYKEQDWMTLDTSKLDDIDAHFDDEFGGADNENSSDSEEEKIEEFYCIACDKSFKSDKALANHEKSKKHKENVELIKNEMDDDLLEDLRVEDIQLENDDIDDETCEVPKTDSLNSLDDEHNLFQRVSSLNLVENAVKLNVIEKQDKVVNEKIENNLAHHTTDSLIYTKMKGISSDGAGKVKSKKKTKKKKLSHVQDEDEAEPFDAINIHAKNSLYMPRRKSKKQQMHESVERLRTLNKLENDEIDNAFVGGVSVTDSLKIAKRKSTKADRKKGRHQLLEKSESSSGDSDDYNEIVIAVETIADDALNCDEVKSNLSDDMSDSSPELSNKLNGDSINNKSIIDDENYLEVNELVNTTDSLRYNKEKMEHHGKNILYQKKFQEMIDEDKDADGQSYKSKNKCKNTSRRNNDTGISNELFKCGICNKEYPSKNKLFNHIKAEGHAILKNDTERKSRKKKGKNS